MPHEDLRQYLKVLEKLGKLKIIHKEVDKDWEISAVSRVAFRSIPERQRPALMFENVKGYTIPVVLGVLGASREIYAAALETEQAQIPERWRKAQKEPLAPVLVKEAPCQENVLMGEKANVLDFPVPVWDLTF